jgi:hypothetical protein
MDTLQSLVARTNNPIEHVFLDGRYASSIMVQEVVEVHNVTRFNVYSNLIATKYIDVQMHIVQDKGNMASKV